MTLARQPIRALSALLLVAAFYAAPASAQEAADSDLPAEYGAAPAKPAATAVKPPVAQWAPKAVVARPKAPPAAKVVEAAEPVEPVAIPQPPKALLPEVPKAPPPPKVESAPKAPGPWLRKTADAAAPVASGASGPSPWRMVALSVLVGGLGAAALFQRRRKTKLARAVRSDLTVVSAARVGNKAQVVVVNVGGRKLLLGVTEAEVSHLAWLDGDAEPASAELGEPEAFEGPARFTQPVSQPSDVDSGHVLGARSAAQAPAPRRFREILFNALGHEEREPARANPMVESAAMQLAEATRDTVTRTPVGAATRAATGTRVASPAGAPEMVDIEGQARGLVLRLQKRA
jgi:flagellar biogenesis protein FliO